MFLCVLVCLLSLSTGCEGRGFFTPTPDYDFNSTIYYSFYSNASNDELEEFLNSSDSFDLDGDDEEAVTLETPLATTPRGGVRAAAAPSVCADIQALLWTLTVMILNAPWIHPL